MIELRKGDLGIDLCRIGEYYLGTRFDRAGVFRRIVKGGYAYADEWFREYDPWRHDTVCGPSEEFMTVDWSDVAVGDTFLKPGVGLLRRPDEMEYDRFRLYPIADEGEWTVECTSESAIFRHRIEGYYIYEKSIELISDSSFSIRHWLRWEAERILSGHSYNHNFLTFGGKKVGPDRSIEFRFKPTGNWRKEYSNAGIEGRSVVFHDVVDPSNCVFMGDLHNSEGPTEYDITVTDRGRKVHIKGSHPATHCVLWSSDTVACIEPYVPLHLEKGQEAGWSITYYL